MAIDWDKYRYFDRYEFDDPDEPGSGDYIDEELVKQLNYLRGKTDAPIITHWKVGGCIDVNGTHGHADNSYHLKKNGGAVDFHFRTDMSPRRQYWEVANAGFTGIGVYYDWHWDGDKLNIGFHVDYRPVRKAQIWRRDNGQYTYFLA
jgi:hypothetical protein